MWKCLNCWQSHAFPPRFYGLNYMSCEAGSPFIFRPLQIGQTHLKRSPICRFAGHATKAGILFFVNRYDLVLIWPGCCWCSLNSWAPRFLGTMQGVSGKACGGLTVTEVEIRLYVKKRHVTAPNRSEPEKSPFSHPIGGCKPPPGHPTRVLRLSRTPCETTNPGMPCAVSRRGAPRSCLYCPCALNAGSCSLEGGDWYLNT